MQNNNKFLRRMSQLLGIRQSSASEIKPSTECNIINF